MNNDIRKVNDVLKAGGIILYYSETGWGIGCDATNRQAVQQLLRIMQYKQSEELVVLLENPGLLDRYVQVVPDIAWDLLEVSINPLTIIFTGAKNIAPELTGKDNNIGIRITKDDFLVKLLQRFRRPLVFIPAVTGMADSQWTFDNISSDLTEAVDYVVEYKQDGISPASNPEIIKLWAGGRVDLIRP